jgi:hypothetical protein
MPLPTLPAPVPLGALPPGTVLGGMMIGVVDPVVLGVAGVVVFGICTLFGDTVPPGTTAFGETVPFGATALGVVVFGNTVWPELTVAPVLGLVFSPPFGTTVALGAERFGATVLLGPAVFGATVLLGPVRALVGFCALAAPLGTVVPGASVVPGATALLVVAARCCCCWVRQAGRWGAVSIMQFVPGGKAVFWAMAVAAAPAVPIRTAPVRTAR